MTAVKVCAICDIADCHHIRARRATPATEPQGYVEGLEAALRYYADDANGNDGWTADQSVARAALAARPAPQPAADEYPELMVALDAATEPHRLVMAPQPAADTRVVTVAQLDEWASAIEFWDSSTASEEIRAIIGEPGK